MGATSAQVNLSPDVLQWARERADLDIETLADAMKVDVDEVLRWESSGDIRVDLIGELSRETRTPLGFLYLSAPFDEDLPIKDFRTHHGVRPNRPSPELIDTVRSMRRRQAWMREELLQAGHEPLSFVGVASTNDQVVDIARQMRKQLGLERGWASEVSSWDRATAHLRDRFESSGILVVFNGVVGNNTHRPLNAGEFRGFALVDDIAPLIFVNAADFKSAQMFTLAHECAHIWIGVSAISSHERLIPTNHREEEWCNAVAAEFLVPKSEFLQSWDDAAGTANFSRLARQFKVSSIVIARRALDLGRIDKKQYDEIYQRFTVTANSGAGGDFWNTQNVRVGRRFGSAVASAVKSNRLLYRDASILTDLKIDTLEEYFKRLGY